MHLFNTKYSIFHLISIDETTRFKNPIIQKNYHKCTNLKKIPITKQNQYY